MRKVDSYMLIFMVLILLEMAAYAAPVTAAKTRG